MENIKIPRVSVLQGKSLDVETIQETMSLSIALKIFLGSCMSYCQSIEDP